MVRRGVLAAGLASCFAVSVFALQAEMPREWLLLSRIKRNMAENLQRLPNYTCLETIERSESAAPSRPFAVVDVLRLEVAQVGKEELFAWPGSRRFEEKDLGRLVGVGIIGTGDFALHVRSVFGSIVPTFAYLGEEDLNGRRAHRYQFRVSRLLSGYTIRAQGGKSVVPYHGSFWADAESLELLLMEVRVEEIPPELGILSAVTRIQYAKTRIGDSAFLLPQSAELLLTRRTGNISRNRIEFTHCRQFGTQTVVSFEIPDTQPAARKSNPVTEIELPPGLSIQVELETVVDSGQSVVGDPIRGRVAKEVLHNERVIVPRGAVLTGRIRTLGRYSGPSTRYMVGLEFAQLEFDGAHARFFARLEETPSLPGARREAAFPRNWVSGRTVDDLGRREEVTTRETTTYSGLPGVGTFFVESKRVQLPRGFRMIWRTVEPARIEKP